MTPVEAFIERLRNAPPDAPLDMRAIHDGIHDLYASASSREREALLAMFHATIDIWKRRTRPEDHAEVERVREQDYNLLLLSECTDSTGNVVPSRLLAVCQREIAGGRMSPDDKAHELAKAGVAVLEPLAREPRKPGFLKRLFGV